MITILYRILAEPYEPTEDKPYGHERNHIRYLERDKIVLYKYSRISDGNRRSHICDGITNPIEQFENHYVFKKEALSRWRKKI
jgi:hypothetical protein